MINKGAVKALHGSPVYVCTEIHNKCLHVSRRVGHTWLRLTLVYDGIEIESRGRKQVFSVRLYLSLDLIVILYTFR